MKGLCEASRFQCCFPAVEFCQSKAPGVGASSPSLKVEQRKAHCYRSQATGTHPPHQLMGRTTYNLGRSVLVQALVVAGRGQRIPAVSSAQPHAVHSQHSLYGVKSQASPAGQEKGVSVVSAPRRLVGAKGRMASGGAQSRRALKAAPA